MIQYIITMGQDAIGNLKDSTHVIISDTCYCKQHTFIIQNVLAHHTPQCTHTHTHTKNTHTYTHTHTHTHTHTKHTHTYTHTYTHTHKTHTHTHTHTVKWLHPPGAQWSMCAGVLESLALSPNTPTPLLLKNLPSS